MKGAVRSGAVVASPDDMTNLEIGGMAPSPERSADLTPVSEIMARDVVSVPPHLGVEELAELLLSKGISGVPVVDELGKPIGVVSKTDLLPPRGTPTRSNATVADIMMRCAFFVVESESIAKAAGLMAYEGVHRVPVVGAKGTVTGMVSPLDVMRWLARKHGYPIGNRPVGRP
jgi:CBS domain-containing protein